MFRFAIALITLALPLAATPAFACGMETEDTVELADLMAFIDDTKDNVVEAAKDTVKEIVGIEQAPSPPPQMLSDLEGARGSEQQQGRTEGSRM